MRWWASSAHLDLLPLGACYTDDQVHRDGSLGIREAATCTTPSSMVTVRSIELDTENQERSEYVEFHCSEFVKK